MNVFVCGCIEDFRNMEIIEIVDKVYNPFLIKNL